MKEKTTLGSKILSLTFAVLSVFWLVPIFLTLINSFKSNNFVNLEAFALPNSESFVGWANYVKGMESAGYVRTTDKALADLGLQISYVEDTYRFRYFNDYPWWYGYPWYWSCGYWGNWGGWYWPYNITYSYTTGSVLGELVDLTESPDTSKTLRVVWTSYITGLLNGNGSLNTADVQSSISQAFAQSPYLKQ